MVLSLQEAPRGARERARCTDPSRGHAWWKSRPSQEQKSRRVRAVAGGGQYREREMPSGYTHTHTRASSESETETPVRLLASPSFNSSLPNPSITPHYRYSTLRPLEFHRRQRSSFTRSLVYSLSSSSESSESSPSWIASRKGRLAAHNFLPSSPPTCRAAALLYHANTASSLTTSCS